MNSEKVKEIKKALENCQKNNCLDCPYFIDEKRCRANDLLLDTITLINELESENERLNKSDTSKEESSIEYYNLYKGFKRKNKDLNELCERQRVSIAESFVRENQLKDRIDELEKENAIKTDTIVDLLKKHEFYEKEKLIKFAEMLKEKLKEKVNADNVDVFVECAKLSNETLKEFISGEVKRED